MRISDWSSDVCSSDLLAQGIVHARAPGIQAMTANQVADAIGVSLKPRLHLGGQACDVLVVVENRHADTGFVGRHTAEGFLQFVVFEAIGRASCRERVCQYGTISVGAGSIKKKK